MQKVCETIGLLLFTLLALAACTGRNPQTPKKSTQPQDTIYTQQAAMDIYDYDPVRALEIVDSAVIVGNLSDWQADKNRARIYCQTRLRERLDSLMHWPADARLDTARVIGERLLRHDSVKNRLNEQQDVLEILAMAARLKKDTVTWLLRSQQLVEVCRQQGAETEALRNEAEVGAALCRLGQPDKGMAMLDSVISALSEEFLAELSGKAERRVKSEEFASAVPSADEGAAPCPAGNSSLFTLHSSFKFNELDALVIALKRKIGVMTATGQTVEILPLARRIVTVLSDYEQHPDQYHDGTYREPPADRREDYIRFYRTQAENFIATAYADLGKTGDMQATFERLENIIIDAEAREHLARYRALEQKMTAERERLEMEAQAQRNLYFAVIVCILLVVALAALAWYFRQMRIVKQKNRYLAQYIEKSLNQQTLTQKTLPQPLPVREGSNYSQGEDALEELSTPLPHREGQGGGSADSSLFAQIHDTIIRESLYLNPNCDRQMLTDRFGLSKERLGSLFVQYSDAKNVSAFINGLRLAHAAQLLTTQPDLDIREVAAASGFGSHQYFSTCFKQRFGLSPTDYRAAKGL